MEHRWGSRRLKYDEHIFKLLEGAAEELYTGHNNFRFQKTTGIDNKINCIYTPGKKQVEENQPTWIYSKCIMSNKLNFLLEQDNKTFRERKKYMSVSPLY